ncbi:DUF222 domain-containing protein [Galbitalea sp. SE-J8]|uniref:HNH endonuclease signature motif containing protein n=1 Tax=Galbitalea sp. SE-J8 TaxID=3054952 RepID=UPI00259CC12B|nr:HNH endonuclease signature motif containing protein [Galbitalea sp. SE-J8]MDM4763229.1 DUF222 domain-containing protein [Galbitalea sp. SE-J8]
MYSNLGARHASRVAGVEAARDAVRALVEEPVAGYTDRELVAMIGDFEELGRLVDAFRCLLAGEADARSDDPDSLARRFGQTRAASLIAQLARVSGATAGDRVRVGAAIRPRTPFPGDAAPDQVLPPAREHLAGAVTAGRVGIDSALTIDRCLTQARRGPASLTALEGCEAELTASATSNPADYLALESRVWRDVLDPDGIEPRADDIHRRRSLTLGREHHGLTPITGRLAPELAALLRANFAEALSPDATPRFLSEDDCLTTPTAAGITITSPDQNERARASERERGSGRGHEVARRLDPRTREQKQHDVLMGLLTAGTRATGTEPGQMRPLTTVLATITATELLHHTTNDTIAGGAFGGGALGADTLAGGTFAGRGGLVGTGLVGTGRMAEVDETAPASMIAQAVCDAGLRILTLDGQGNPLDEGRRYRLFTTRQRRVIAIRDGGCAVPGCTAPASWTEVHHILWWKAHHGATDITNGILLCPKHHRDVHRGHFAIRLIDGRPHLIPAPWIDPDRRPQPMGHPLGRPRHTPPSTSRHRTTTPRAPTDTPQRT